MRNHQLHAIPILLGLFLLLQPPATRAVQAEQIQFAGKEFIICWVDPKSEELSLFWKDSAGQPIGSFDRLRNHLGPRERALRFAINAGIFSQQQQPLGLHIEEGKVLRKLKLDGLEGGQVNFYMKPNGVFYLVDQTAGILESAEFATSGLRPRVACQSGPLLLRQGQIHPEFRPGSTNFHWRSGVGVTKTGRVVFAISKSTLCFYDFARLFQSRLGCENALYLDGDICAIYSPELGYRGVDLGTRFAGIFGVLAKSRASPVAPR